MTLAGHYVGRGGENLLSMREESHLHFSHGEYIVYRDREGDMLFVFGLELQFVQIIMAMHFGHNCIYIREEGWYVRDYLHETTGSK